MFKSFLNTAKSYAIGDSGSKATKPEELFPVVSKEVDGDDCDHECATCTIQYPRSFKIDEEDELYGQIKGWATHVLVATNKTDWVHDVADEKGSVMQAIAGAKAPANGKLMLSASNLPTPHGTTSYSEPTTLLLLPAFILIENVTPATVPFLLEKIISNAPTNTSPLTPFSIPPSLEAPLPEATPAYIKELTTRPCPHQALILLCSQKTRDARCGQSAPLLRKELQRHLQPLGLYRDLDDERPGGVGIYFISHVGGHKYSANMLVYRRPKAFGLDEVKRAEEGELKPKKPEEIKKQKASEGGEAEQKAEGAEEGEGEDGEMGAAQCIWLARVKPEDCEGIVKFTVLQGKVIKPQSQLRGGFDRQRKVLSW
ncbi:Sucrase/ferredoxin-like-domain-containing protein [Sordaria brevicollis]|uniref:Sucrase/ferredoxin-like-domain-containing protein n=1 Tax=Sordaria brevicollis TaxID=83679 RepID=A0AAE0PKC6_SORBR|nr:Sucrase/ferredoxin-like-domain-containing protein [Sordaria brevicollis]